MNYFKRVFLLGKYSFLMTQLVRRDFKLKYRGSALGVLWSVLNPLLNMIVLSIVFNQVFKAVDNYRMFLLSGLVIFNFFSEATNSSIGAVVNNFGLITKVYFPKIILPFSKTLSSGINLLFSVLAFLLIGNILGLKAWWGYLLIPYVLLCLLIFSSGVSFILSALQVFFRDVQYLYGVLLTIWMYSTPILYPIDIIPGNLIGLFKANPLYIFIDFLRQITLESVIPPLQSFLYCALWTLGSFVAGVVFFVKTQDKFIYYS